MERVYSYNPGAHTWAITSLQWSQCRSITSTCPPTVGEKRRLQLFTFTLWIPSAFIPGVWTWCLEQSASSAERHCCCLHLQASLKVWTLLSNLRRFDDCFNCCWTLRQIALLIVFYWRYVCCLHFNFVFSVIVGLYANIIYLHCQAPPSMFCRGRYKNSGDCLIDWKCGSIFTLDSQFLNQFSSISSVWLQPTFFETNLVVNSLLGDYTSEVFTRQSLSDTIFQFRDWDDVAVTKSVWNLLA